MEGSRDRKYLFDVSVDDHDSFNTRQCEEINFEKLPRSILSYTRIHANVSTLSSCDYYIYISYTYYMYIYISALYNASGVLLQCNFNVPL